MMFGPPDMTDDRQVRRYLLYYQDLFDAAPAHSRGMGKTIYEWAKHHWYTHGHREGRKACFDHLEPNLIFKVQDYQWKVILLDDQSLWTSLAADGNPLSELKKEVSTIPFQSS